MAEIPLKKIDKYHIIRKLGDGGVAEVYLARYSGQERFQKQFAIKVLLPEMATDEEIRDMLIDEARIQALLDHDNIVKVIELGVIDEPKPTFFIVMEHVDGKNMDFIAKQMLAHGKEMPLPYKLHIVHEVLKGLDFAHTRCDQYNTPLGIVHRDISPHNILISLQGSVKVADFGIAKAKQHFRATEKTAVNTLKGKYAYMSPEQVMGQEIDQTTDIFAAGIILFELITGQRAFHQENPLHTMELVRQAKYPDELLNSIDPALAAIIRKALAKEKDGRFQTAHEFSNEIWKYMQSKSYYVTERDLGNFVRGLILQTNEDHEEKITEPSDRSDIRQTKTDTPAPTVIKKQDKTPTKSREFSQETFRVAGRTKKYRNIFLALLAVLASASSFAILHSKKTSPAPAPVKTQLAAVELGPETPKITKEEIPKERPKARAQYGMLSVVTKPWGYVSISDVVNKAETPYHKRLQAGDYRIMIWSSGEGGGQPVEKQITIKENATTKCFATFDGAIPNVICN